MSSTAAERGDELAEFVADAIMSEMTEGERQVVYSRVRNALAALPMYRPPPVAPHPTIRPMTDAEAERFEMTPLDFGRYRGVLIQTVPLDYLCWFADQPEQQVKADIRRYLKAPRIAERVRIMQTEED